MKTARFANVVQTCGVPEAYLLLMDPAKDRTFQTAINAQRVMTVFQEAVGSRTDRGEVGYQPGRARQFLVFPKSLRSFAGRVIVGIKYDLLKTREIPKNERAPSPRAPKPKSRPKRAPAVRRKEEPEPTKVVAFKPETPDADDDDEEIADLKKQVRHAMRVLEDGKAVAAFNLLKRIVGE